MLHYLAGLRSGCSKQGSRKQTLWACSKGLRNGAPGVKCAQVDYARGNLAMEERECLSSLVLVKHYESDFKRADSLL